MKKFKILTAVVLVIVLSMAMTACGANNAGSDAEPAVIPDATSGEPLEDLAKSKTAGSEWEAVYAPTLQMFMDISQRGFDQKYRDMFDTLGVSFYVDDYGDNVFQYAYYDINGDSVPELLVLCEQAGGSIITVYIYSVSGNNVVPVLYTHYNLNGMVHLAKSDKGTAYIVESGGDEGFGGANIFEITKGEPKAVEIDTISVIYSRQTNKLVYIHGLTGETVVDGDKHYGTEISENEFNSLAVKYGGEMYGYYARSQNYINLDWMGLQNPGGASLTIDPKIKGGIFIRSEPEVTGKSSEMADGNKIGYIREGKTDVILRGTGKTEIGNDGFMWYQVRIPQEFRDTAEQTKYYKDKPMVGWVREDVVVFARMGGAEGSLNEKIFELLGKTPAEIEQAYAKYEKSDWLSGPIHKFGNYWFAFEDTDSKGNPAGKSTSLICKASDVIVGLSGDIKASELDDVFGNRGKYEPNTEGGSELFTEGYMEYEYRAWGVDLGCSPEKVVYKNSSVRICFK